MVNNLITESLRRFLMPGFLLVLFLLFPVSCGKDSWHPVPSVPVSFTINIESTINIELNNIGGWAYYSGGHRGIIIYRWSVDEFRAFDRACPHHPFEACALIRVEDPPVAKCSCCESLFLLLDGSVVRGPSRFPLKQYRTYLQFPFLSVSNW